MKSVLIRVRYYQGNVYLAAAINHDPPLMGQSPASFDAAANALGFRAFRGLPFEIRPAAREEIAADSQRIPSERVTRNLIETRYFIAAPV